MDQGRPLMRLADRSATLKVSNATTSRGRDHHGHRARLVLPQGLVRPQEGRVLGGVCAGLGRRFGIDPWPARLLFVLILFVIPGSQILIYPILWLLMPDEHRAVAPRPASPAGPVPPGVPPAPAV